MKHLKFCAALCAAAMLLTGCGTGNSDAENSAVTTPAPPSGLNLVTLGDSISAGYGLENREQERYSALLCNALEQTDNRKWNDYNYAVSGDDSSDLIQRLNDGRALRLPSADTIIIYIGANNLLGVYTGFAQDMVKDLNIDPDSYTDEDIERVQDAVKEKMQDKDTILTDLEKQLDDSLLRLQNDLETIYAWVRERNADADIYVLNIYNPFKDTEDSDMLELDEPFGDYAQRQIDRANKILTDFTAAHSDLIFVDLASRFNAANPLPIIGGDPETDGYVDPHPNADGQKLIAEVLKEAMRGK